MKILTFSRIFAGDAVWADIGAYATPRSGGRTTKELGAYGEYTVALETQPGDVVVFNHRIKHASFGGGDGRHQHALSFMANPKTDAEMAAVRTHYEKAKYGLHPAESYVHSDRPRIRRMVSTLVEWGFETSKV